MFFKKKLPLIFFCFLLMPFVTGFSLSPGIYYTYFEPDAKSSTSFSVYNYGETRMFHFIPSSRSPELKSIINDVIIMENSNIIIKNGQTMKFFPEIHMPKSLSPGTHEIRIRISPDDAPKKGATITARSNLIFKIIIYSLVPGKYLEAKFLAVNSVNVGKPVRFVTEVHNLGTEDVADAKIRIDIYRGSIFIESISSGDTHIKSKVKKPIVPQLDTAGYLSGSYTARAFLEYDGKIQNLTPVRSFNIGELNVEIINISTTKFENNKINKFDVFVRNKWNDQIDIFGDVVVTNSSGDELAEFRTQTINAKRLSAATIPAYFDINNINSDNYSMNMTLRFEGSSRSKIFPIEIMDKYESAVIVEEIPTEKFSIKQSFMEQKGKIIIAGQAALIIGLIGTMLILLRRKKSEVKKKPSKKKKPSRKK